MKKIFFLLPALLLIVACKEKQVVQPQIRQLTEAVYASGTLLPESEYKVVAATDGFLEKSFVKEGDTIRKGQLLFQLSNENQKAQVQVAGQIVKKTLPVTGSNSPALADIENRIAAATIRLSNDQQQYERYKNLYEQNAISASTYEKYMLQYQTTSKEVASLRQQLQQQRLSAELQLQHANNQLQIASISRGNGLIKSFADGIIYDVNRQTGDMIYPNQQIALVGTGKMIAKLFVDEDDFEKVREGQKVFITMDAYPGKTFSATLQKIYPLLNKVEQSFRVDALFDHELPANVYGLNIEANIVIKDKVKTMVIPKKAIRKGDSVMLKKGGKLSTVKITTGVEDKQWVQVVHGLDSFSQSIVLE